MENWWESTIVVLARQPVGVVLFASTWRVSDKFQDQSLNLFVSGFGGAKKRKPIAKLDDIVLQGGAINHAHSWRGCITFQFSKDHVTMYFISKEPQIWSRSGVLYHFKYQVLKTLNLHPNQMFFSWDTGSRIDWSSPHAMKRYTIRIPEKNAKLLMFSIPNYEI